VQGLAVLATVSEAAARWYAVGLQRRAEAQTQADRVSTAGREQSEQLARQAEVEQDRAERQHITMAVRR
jgi:hypothetical protein